MFTYIDHKYEIELITPKSGWTSDPCAKNGTQCFNHCVVVFKRVRTAGAAASSTETRRRRQTTSATVSSTSLRSKLSTSCQLDFVLLIELHNVNNKETEPERHRNIWHRWSVRVQGDWEYLIWIHKPVFFLVSKSQTLAHISGKDI